MKCHVVDHDAGNTLAFIWIIECDLVLFLGFPVDIHFPGVGMDVGLFLWAQFGGSER